MYLLLNTFSLSSFQKMFCYFIVFPFKNCPLKNCKPFARQGNIDEIETQIDNLIVEILIKKEKVAFMLHHFNFIRALVLENANVKSKENLEF